MKTPRTPSGFSLIEVLVALFVFSLAILGLAGLQLIGLAGTQGASLRSTATYLAYDMADRVRANQAGASAGRYNNVTAADGQCQAAHFAELHATPASCNVTVLAQDDVFDWNAALAAQLPGGSGIVCIDSTPNDGTAAAPACDGTGTAYAVKVWWTDKPKDEAAVVRRISIGFQP